MGGTASAVERSGFVAEERRLGARDLVALVRHPPETLLRLLEGRDLVVLKLGRRRIAALNNPRLIGEVFAADDRRGRLAGFGEATARRLGGASVPNVDGEAHRRRRSIIEPLFERDAVAGWTGDIAQAAERGAAEWTDGAVIDAVAAMERIAVDAVARVVFGDDYDRERAALTPYYDVSREVVMRIINPLAPVLWRLPLRVNRRFARAQASFNEAVDRMVASRSDDRANGDLLARLVRARADGDVALAAVEARDEAWTYYSQSAPMYALTWIWWLLGTHPEAEAELHRELDDVLAGRSPGAGDIDRLPFLQAVFREATRVYPPGWASFRPADRRETVAGRTVEVDTVLLISPYALHRDERFWPNAETFDPWRWLGDRGAEIPAYAYIAFGAGPRRCPARPFAELVCTTVVATLGQRWRLRPTRTAVELAYVPFLRPRRGLPVRLEAKRAR